MSIYDKASLVLIPSGTKTSKVYSQKPVNGDGDFTFSRSTAATRVNADGNIEKETQNLFTYSNTFNNVAWSQSGSVTGGQTDRDGGNDAWIVSSVAGSSLIGSQIITLSGVTTFSIYVKINPTNGFGIGFVSLSNAALFDISDATKTAAVTETGLISSSQEYVGNNFYRLSVTTNMSGSIQMKMYLTTADGTSSDTSGGTQIVQDAQLEQGLVARDYIETTTAAVEGGITDNVPRLDYTDSSCPALLLEPQRTNIFEDGEYVASTRGTSNGAFIYNDTTSPEGLVNGHKFYENTNTSLHFARLGSVGVDTYTFSAYMKASGRNKVLVTADYNNGAVFNVSTGEVDFYIGSGYTASVEDAGNGWYRCIATFTTTASATFYLSLLNDNNDTSYAGDGTSGVHIYGVQCEAGSYATSYIPTYGTSVTRNEDTYKKLGFGNTSTEGTFYAEFEVKKIESANGQYMYGLSVGTTDLGNFYAATSGALSIIANGPNIQGFNNGYNDSLFSYTPSIGDTAKIAIRYDGSNVVAFVNGVKQTTKTDNASGVKNSIRVNHGEKSSHATKQLLFIPTALTDQEAIDLTTI